MEIEHFVPLGIAMLAFAIVALTLLCRELRSRRSNREKDSTPD